MRECASWHALVRREPPSSPGTPLNAQPARKALPQSCHPALAPSVITPDLSNKRHFSRQTHAKLALAWVASTTSSARKASCRMRSPRVHAEFRTGCLTRNTSDNLCVPQLLCILHQFLSEGFQGSLAVSRTLIDGDIYPGRHLRQQRQTRSCQDKIALIPCYSRNLEMWLGPC